MLDALTFMYKRLILSRAEPKITSILEARHLAHFGHKYEVQVLLDASDAFMHQWCRVNFLKLTYTRHPSHHHKHETVLETNKVLQYIALAEATSLKKTLGVCERWFVVHFWALGLCFQSGAGLGAAVDPLRIDTLARIFAGVEAEYRGSITKPPMDW